MKKDDFIVIVRHYIVPKNKADEVAVRADNAAEKAGAAHAQITERRELTDKEWEEFPR